MGGGVSNLAPDRPGVAAQLVHARAVARPPEAKGVVVRAREEEAAHLEADVRECKGV